jgi:dTDP-4-dehydrorhamnose reductase
MELALKAAKKAGIDTSRLDGRCGGELGYVAVRPLYSALSSERGILLPSLDDALDRYIESRRQEAPAEAEESKSGRRGSGMVGTSSDDFHRRIHTS